MGPATADRGIPVRAGRGTLQGMRTEPGSVRTHVRFKYGDADGEVLYEYEVGSVGYIPTEGETVTLPVDYDEKRFKQYVVTRRHFFYSEWQENISTQHINIIVADA